jgi:hypothetical protein
MQVEIFWIVIPCSVAVGYHLRDAASIFRVKREVALSTEMLVSYHNIT